MPEKPAAIQSAAERRRPEPEPVDLAILYEDDSLVVVDKPPGLVVHPTYRNTTGTLLNGLLWRLRGRPGMVPSIITRLDKNTSGLVLVALTPEVHARVQRDAEAGRVRKEYLAVVRGIPTPPAGSIALPLARSPEDRRRVIVTLAGQASETRYHVLASDVPGPDMVSTPCSLVRCELVTGRTHQIRVHFASVGHPILGDAIYGIPHLEVSRQALHAWRLTLTHPATGAPLHVESPIPADFHAIAGRLTRKG
jgi:23S rRNA pseudouridine1911/1915/1917 synthase